MPTISVYDQLLNNVRYDIFENNSFDKLLDFYHNNKTPEVHQLLSTYIIRQDLFCLFARIHARSLEMKDFELLFETILNQREDYNLLDAWTEFLGAFKEPIKNPNHPYYDQFQQYYQQYQTQIHQKLEGCVKRELERANYKSNILLNFLYLPPHNMVCYILLSSNLTFLYKNDPKMITKEYLDILKNPKYRKVVLGWGLEEPSNIEEIEWLTKYELLGYDGAECIVEGPLIEEIKIHL